MIKGPLLFWAFALGVLIPILAAGQTMEVIEPDLRARIDRIAVGVMEQHGIPSASLAVVKNGRVVYTHAYGKAHINPDKPATPEMRYSIGSISKQFASAAILMLQEQGKLSVDDAVGKYVPGLTRGDEVTIRQILSHTAGYQDYWPEDYLITPMVKPITPQQILDKWAKKPLDFEPGTQWQYSNTGYVIAGLIVEKVSGEKLMDFLQEHIFRPLGMKAVWDCDEEELPAADAMRYMRAAMGPLRPAPKEGRGWIFAGGQLAMTAHDLALWDESLIARSLLKPESYNEMFTEVKLTNGKGTGYGLGVEVGKQNGHLELSHDGEVMGFFAFNDVLADDGAAVAVLTNYMGLGAEEIAELTLSAVTKKSMKPAEEQALAIYHGLQLGHLDRTLLAPNLNDYFDAKTMADFRDSLGPLGEPLKFREVAESPRGGMTFRAFQIDYPTVRLDLTTYTYPDGKFEQYLVERKEGACGPPL